jgi:hypothetical protein
LAHLIALSFESGASLGRSALYKNRTRLIITFLKAHLFWRFLLVRFANPPPRKTMRPPALQMTKEAGLAALGVEAIKF